MIYSGVWRFLLIFIPSRVGRSYRKSIENPLVHLGPVWRGKVSVGALTSVKLDSLPFQQYGDLKGTLSYLSQDTYEKSLNGENGAFYRGRVNVSPSQLLTLPSGFRLTSGMTASADMKVGERRIITYLLNPIIKGLTESFREPN